MRKLSEIIIEIAKTALNDEKHGDSELMHTLMFLAHVAWNRDTIGPNYIQGKELLDNIKELPHDKHQMKKELISDDWNDILQKMITYKKTLFPNDMRKITLCSYTPWQTLRIEWK